MFEQLLEIADPGLVADRIIGYLPQIAGAVIVTVLFWTLGVAVRKAARGVLKRTQVPPDAQGLLLRFLKYVVVIIAALTVSDQLGIDVTSMVAGLGIAGLALSFAAQDTIANIISGVAILIDRPFQQGDWISFSGMHASVSEIRLRTTVLTTFDNETVVVPNRDLAQQHVMNYTLTPRIRVRVPVGIAYKEDTEAARRVMLSVVQGDDRIMTDPAPAVLVSSLGDSSVNLELRFWTEESIMKFPLMWEYTEKCKRALDEADIEIPFPHMQLFLEKSEGLKMLAGKRGPQG